tara:strand:- start:979 stop:1245 length:267 start_codon:yes stop_codon:yes gene_type:complete
MKKEYYSLDEILEDADNGTISDNQLKEEGYTRCFCCGNTEDTYYGGTKILKDILIKLKWHFEQRPIAKPDINKRKWLCQTCKEEFEEA